MFSGIDHEEMVAECLELDKSEPTGSTTCHEETFPAPVAGRLLRLSGNRGLNGGLGAHFDRDQRRKKPHVHSRRRLYSRSVPNGPIGLW